jgi:hypothetical protein
MPTGDPANPWSQDAFQIARPPAQPAFHPKGVKPHDIPDTHELFTIQRQLQRALSKMDRDAEGFGDVEDAYRTTNRYLRTYVNSTGRPGGF